jgi:hypothetical protein
LSSGNLEESLNEWKKELPAARIFTGDRRKHPGGVSCEWWLLGPGAVF